MNRLLFGAATALGAAAIAWMALDFAGTHLLAFVLTLAIAAAYCIGIGELLNYRRGTRSLEQALASLPADESAFDTWLAQLPGGLVNPVRARIEGERIGLPAPVFTPYLVGLLVMLGLLGTFIGMVDTLQGTVAALEGTSDLDAIRAALAAPIKGLGLAFGTSVAGVAASAMLGLNSTLCRRDRMLATRVLDSAIAGPLRTHSRGYQQQVAYRALQQQADALPALVEQLNQVSSALGQMGDSVAGSLADSQSRFHEQAGSGFERLLTSMESTMRDHLAQVGELAANGMRPELERALQQVAADSQQTQSAIAAAAQEQVTAFGAALDRTSDNLERALGDSIAAQATANGELNTQLAGTVSAIDQQLQQQAEAVVARLEQASASSLEAQAAADQQRLQALTDTLATANTDSAAAIERLGAELVEQLRARDAEQQAQLEQHSARYAQLTEQMSTQWREASDSSLGALRDTQTQLSEAAQQLAEQAGTGTAQALQQVADLVNGAEALVNARIESEQRWIEDFNTRLDSLGNRIGDELQALIEQEVQRADAAQRDLANLESTVADSLSRLESTAAGHLASLGQELEAPMSALIETAAEAPRAATEVISQLREEVSNGIARDNQLLDEYRQVMAQLADLASELRDTTSEQRGAIETLVSQSAETLAGVGQQFNEQVAGESQNLAEMAADLAASAADVASLGDAFGASVTAFGEANQQLLENLARVEEAMDKSSARSDEQMGYYVSQAREIIDQSMLSQREIIDELRRLGQQSDAFEEAEA